MIQGRSVSSTIQNPQPSGRLRTFWARISEGIELQRIWAQFRADASASYGLYANEVEWTREPGETGPKRILRVAKGLFWAMILKLSPGRRILFLVGLVLLFLPGFRLQYSDAVFEMTNWSFLGGAALVVLLALELADRVTMKRDLEIAREIQSWLVPAAPPEGPGGDLAFATRPANTVAGDYYDAFFRSDGSAESRLLLVVGDVAGKSIPAALLMATMQASLRTLAAVPGSLLDLVQRLNQYACAQNPGGRRFTTAFLAELEPVSGHLTYVNAGHNWPVLRRASGAVERLEAGGLPLGIMAKAPYECASTTLLRGDVLMVFTDGLVEAENDRGEEYGEHRLLYVVQTGAERTPSQLLPTLVADVDRFVAGAPQHDDITSMLVKASN